MRKQKEMVESFQLTHGDFMRNIADSINLLEHDIEEAQEIDQICTGEWCIAIERSFDDLAKDLYSISEPRWTSSKQSGRLRLMRTRLHDLYEKYRGLRSTLVH